MKKCVSFFLALVMMIGMISVADVTMPITSAYVSGDVNGDNALTTADARVLLTYLVSGTTLTGTQQTLADVNSDGKINTSDVKKILDMVMNSSLSSLTTIDLLAPSVEDWHNPVQEVNGTDCAVMETALSSGGYTFVSLGGTWPYTMYTYDAKILVPQNSVIEYDLTVDSDSASINLFTGGDLPEFDDASDPAIVKLNSCISSNVDSGSGDLLTGTYSGSFSVADLNVGTESMEDGMIWISGIKIYIVGGDAGTVTIRKLTVKGYENDPDPRISTDPLETIRTNLVSSTETSGLATLTGLELYQNGTRTNASSMDYYSDYKKIYHTQTKQRVVNYADGYRIDIPYNWEPDYSLSELRSQYESEHYTLTISKEEESPYGNTQSGWETYLTEWLNIYIANEDFLTANDLYYTRTPIVSESTVSGYTVYNYDIAFNNPGDVDKPYYSIAVVRKFYTYNSFYLFVLKSSVPTQHVMDQLLGSFAAVTVRGSAVNSQGQYEQIIPSSWSDETKAYYQKLVEQDSTDFGFFSYSMVTRSEGTSYYNGRAAELKAEYDRLSAAVGAEYDILPTYTHVGWYDTDMHFPLDMARTYAGGNGYNGKPVLQFTYQYTVTNNGELSGYTPVFDIMRGERDEQFRKLAQDIKSYGKPVLFRLNNEMNTDWTSYAGIVTLLDPDIFILTWQRLYDIFEEEGVDNCIWIFNPFDKCTPYSSWGEDLCYMPGAEYVQILGLTGYEEGNSSTVPSFETIYTELYEKNKDYYINYPWVISEFGCGAGGERIYNWTTETWDSYTLGWNQSKQAAWVTAMFDDLNNKASNAYCQNIKGAVWFSANDYTYAMSDDGHIVNYYELQESLTLTLDAFKNGLAGR